MTWDVPDGLDQEVRNLCIALNALPGIETFESCCGHGRKDHGYWICFYVTDYEARGLLTLSRLLSHNYHGHHQFFRIVLDHVDVRYQMCFRLEGDSNDETFMASEALAANIMALVKDRVDYYNILYDTTDGKPPPTGPFEPCFVVAEKTKGG